MVLIKRHITPPTTYEPSNERITMLMDLSHANTVGLLAQISQLFTITNEMFSELVQEASTTSRRIQNLKTRVGKIKSSLLTADACIDQGVDLITPGTQYSNRCTEQAQLYMYEDRVPSMVHQYSNCTPPPNLEILDQYAGESCLKKYSNRDFFLETWIEEERLKYEDAKKKRAERRQNRQNKPTQNLNQRRVVKHVELSRAKYSAMGKEFAENEPIKDNKKESLTLSSFLQPSGGEKGVLSPRENAKNSARSPRSQSTNPLTPSLPPPSPTISQSDSSNTLSSDSSSAIIEKKRSREKSSKKGKEKKEKEKKPKRKVKAADIPLPNYEPPPIPTELPPPLPCLLFFYIILINF